MKTNAETEALANELIRMVSARLKLEGLRPTDEICGGVFITMLATHYAMRGGDAKLRQELLDLLDELMTLAVIRRRSRDADT